jgi:hypothetical protein
MGAAWGGVPAVAVTHLPVTPCQICRRTAACRPGKVRHVLTGHYRVIRTEWWI